MKRASQLRRVLKWGGLAVSLAIATALVISAPFAFCHRWYGYEAWLFGGYFLFLKQGPTQVQQLQGAELPSVLAISIRPLRCILSLWIPFVLVTIPTAFLFWRDRRILPGHCLRCGYDLTANTSGVCPECGERI